ncbi:MAG: hypothetical protein ACREPR_25285, partial [Brasilonema sp.]
MRGIRQFKIQNGLRSAALTKFKILIFLIPLISIGLVACGVRQTNVATKPPLTSPSPGDKDSNLTFFGVTLEQADEVGRPIWKVRAKQAKYTKEKQI